MTRPNEKTRYLQKQEEKAFLHVKTAYTQKYIINFNDIPNLVKVNGFKNNLDG